MDELLQSLEKKIRDFIDQHQHLTQTNQALQQGQATLAKEKDQLLTRQQSAIIQIKNLMTKLRILEKLP